MSAPPGAAVSGWLTVDELLELDNRNGAPCWGSFDRVAEMRKRYLGVQEVPLAHARPCGGCGASTITLIGDIPLHLSCGDPLPGWVPEPAQPPPWFAAADQGEDLGGAGSRHAGAGEQETKTDAGAGVQALAADTAADPARQSGGAQVAEDQLAAVLAADGLWRPGAAAPVPVPWPQDAGQAYALAERLGVRQLWVHPGAHAALGIPHEHGPNPQAPEDHPWCRPAGYACDPPGLAAWVNVAPSGGGRRRAVVLAGYENRAPSWADAPSGRVLADAVAALAAALPKSCHYYLSPNQTAAAVIRHHHRGGVEPARLPPPAVDRVVTHVASWSRLLADDESECTWLHRYDVHGAELATWNVKLGVGDPVHEAAPEWVPRKSKYTAGYWLVSLPGEWRPDARLPNLLRPWQRAREERIWVPTPFLELLTDDLMAPVTLHEAWTWPKSSAWLEASGHSLRDARAALNAQADGCGRCAPCIALGVVKNIYTSQIGNFARRRSPARDEDGVPADVAAAGAQPQDAGGLVASDNPLQREDVNDLVKSKMLCNNYRAYRRVGAGGGRWPVAISSDAVYYASDDPDGPRAIPAGLVLGPGLGQYSHEATVLAAAVRDQLNTQGFSRAVERHLRGSR